MLVWPRFLGEVGGTLGTSTLARIVFAALDGSNTGKGKPGPVIANSLADIFMHSFVGRATNQIAEASQKKESTLRRTLSTRSRQVEEKIAEVEQKIAQRFGANSYVRTLKWTIWLGNAGAIAIAIAQIIDVLRDEKQLTPELGYALADASSVSTCVTYTLLIGLGNRLEDLTLALANPQLIDPHAETEAHRPAWRYFKRNVFDVLIGTLGMTANTVISPWPRLPKPLSALFTLFTVGGIHSYVFLGVKQTLKDSVEPEERVRTYHTGVFEEDYAPTSQATILGNTAKILNVSAILIAFWRAIFSVFSEESGETTFNLNLVTAMCTSISFFIYIMLDNRRSALVTAIPQLPIGSPHDENAPTLPPEPSKNDNAPAVSL
jgi:DNA-binding transcriptional MerR regulator